MTKKRVEVKKVATTTKEPATRHARIELPGGDYDRLKRAADRYHISVAGYIRMAVMERIERDEAKGGGR